MTGHRANIFSAKFLPSSNESQIVSCSANGDIFYNDIEDTSPSANTNKFTCHSERTCFEIRTVASEPHAFTSCGQDGTVRWFDIRIKTKCDKENCHDDTLIKLSNGITAIAINPLIPYHLVCGSLDGIVRFYDRRMLSVGAASDLNYSSLKGLFSCFGYTKGDQQQQQSPRSQRITSLQYDDFGNEILVSYQKDRIYLLDWRDTTISVPEPEPMVEVAENEEKKCDSQQDDDQAKKNFRIQADWSDTGPNSMPMNEQSNADPRTFLMRRLNDWFQELYTRQRSPQPPNTEASQNESESGSSEESSSEEQAQNQQQQQSEQGNEEQRSSTIRNLEANAKRLQILASMRDRVRQTVRKENDLMAELPAPKIKMTFRGHRNARTIVKFKKIKKKRIF